MAKDSSKDVKTVKAYQNKTGDKAPAPKSSRKSIRKKKKIKVVEHTRSSGLIFNNRELGWLNFNLRVLAEVEDSRNPLLERLKFLSISSTNLDEFFMKRVGGLKRHVAYGISAKSSDGQTPEMQLAMITRRLQPMLKKQSDLIAKLTESLRVEGCHIVGYKSLNETEKK